MGFRAFNSTSSRPRIQLVVSLGPDSNKSGTKLDGADAVLTRKAYKGNGEQIRGVETDTGTIEEVTRAKEAGADFVVVPFTGVAVPSDESTGKILQVDASITDIGLRAINELPVDAVLVEEEGDLALTWQRLLAINRYTGLVSKPVLVKMADTATSDELHLVWEAGVSGLVVSVPAGTDGVAIKALRQAIDALPFPARKKKDKVAPTLPGVGVAPKEQEIEEPDEDDGGD